MYPSLVLAVLLAPLPPCRLHDTRAAGGPPAYPGPAISLPLPPGVWAFQIQNSEWTPWCHVPYGTAEVTLVVTILRPRSAGCITFYPRTERTDGGEIVWPEPGAPALCWRNGERRPTVRTSTRLGLDWIPPDLGIVLASGLPVHLTLDVEGPAAPPPPP